jgi:hypothetical protein
MPQVYPREVSMIARPRNAATTNALTAAESAGRFQINTVDKTVSFDLTRELAPYQVSIHGYVPRGWTTDPLFQFEPGQVSGTWNYPRGQEKNLLAGLAYLSARRGSQVLSAQIEPEHQEAATFEDYVTITAMAGDCQARMSLFGQFEDVDMKMEPAQVIIARSAAITRSDGRREQEIGCSIRVGGAQIDGIGRVEIGMFGNQNPGRIVSMVPGSDFPAQMSLDVGKSYITPMGEFYRDNEVFAADGLMRFPPFGTKFYPIEPIAPLRNARTGDIIGQIKLGWLVPLCYLDPSESEFPSEAVANASFDEEPN